MERDFKYVYNKIQALLPKGLAFEMQQNAIYWEPSEKFFELSKFIQAKIKPNSKDDKTVRIYAILCDKSLDEMRKRFIASGK